MKARKIRHLIFGIIAGFLTSLVLAVAIQTFFISRENKSIDAVLASDPDFSHVQRVRITGADDSVAGYVADKQIWTRLSVKLDEAGVAFTNRDIRIDTK